MRFGRLLLSTGLVGLATTLGGASLAEPEGTKSSPTPATPGGAKPAEANKAAQPDRPTPTPGKPQSAPGQGTPGMPGHGPPGARDKGPGPLGSGPADAERMGRGMPGMGPGMHGMGPGGMPGHRFGELIAKEKAGTLTPQEKTQLEQLRKIHAMNMERRDARIKDLREKEQAGKLTDAEKEELAKIGEIQTRFEGLKQKYMERAKDRKKRRLESKRLVLQAFPDAGTNPQLRAEFLKHGKRLAMLERARDVALAGERDDLVARIDQLLEKENQRHEAWVSRQKKDQKAEPAQAKTEPAAEKGATP